MLILVYTDTERFRMTAAVCTYILMLNCTRSADNCVYVYGRITEQARERELKKNSAARENEDGKHILE